ncbi:hypothetical protein ACFS32_13020 [Novosphingobium pokkalii]|uniref:hypothetical protein n=1 Tax=Novosphingobium pokkalii TaxID=1770194 RepID=UPI0036387558
MSDSVREGVTDAGEESLIILESLLCVLREKNLLTRSDIELLCERWSVAPPAPAAIPALQQWQRH